jgi:hypothetical protein
LGVTLDNKKTNIQNLNSKVKRYFMIPVVRGNKGLAFGL